MSASIIDSGQVVIHISGPSAVGKSYFAKHLREVFGDEIAVKDSDEYAEQGTETAARLDKIYNDDEYTAAWLDILRAGARDFIVANKEKRAIVFVGFFDWFAMSDKQYVDEMCAYATERYYLTKPMSLLQAQFFKRVGLITREHNLQKSFEIGKIPRFTTMEYESYELDLRIKHETAHFTSMTKRQILDRIDSLIFRIDSSKIIKFCWRSGSRKSNGGHVLKAVLIYRTSLDMHTPDEVETQVECSSRKVTPRNCYIPLAHGVKIWNLAYKLNKEGAFTIKNLPNYEDSVFYDGFYACGKTIKPLIDLITVFVK